MEFKLKKQKEDELSLKSLRKTFAITVFFNLAFLLERTVFDFLGFMFGMIIADVVYILFLLIGLFGAFQYRVNYIVALILTSLFWIAWNLFVICVYLDVGQLERYDPYILNLNTNKRSWWFSNNIGCLSPISPDYLLLAHRHHYQKTRSIEPNSHNRSLATHETHGAFAINQQSNDVFLTSTANNYTFIDNFLRENCFLPFFWIEIIQSGVLIFASILCTIFGVLLSNSFNNREKPINQEYVVGLDTENGIANGSIISDNQLIHGTQTLTSAATDLSKYSRTDGLIQLEPIYKYSSNSIKF